MSHLIKLQPNHYINLDQIADIDYTPPDGGMSSPISAKLDIELTDGTTITFQNAVAETIWTDLEDVLNKRERKGGSNWCVAVVGAAMTILALAMFFGGWNGDLGLYKNQVNGGAALVFGMVLIWWAITEKHDKISIDFPTVAMVVGTVAALIAVLGWTNGAARRGVEDKKAEIVNSAPLSAPSVAAPAPVVAVPAQPAAKPLGSTGTSSHQKNKYWKRRPQSASHTG